MADLFAGLEFSLGPGIDDGVGTSCAGGASHRSFGVQAWLWHSKAGCVLRAVQSRAAYGAWQSLLVVCARTLQRRRDASVRALPSRKVHSATRRTPLQAVRHVVPSPSCTRLSRARTHACYIFAHPTCAACNVPSPTGYEPDTRGRASARHQRWTAMPTCETRRRPAACAGSHSWGSGARGCC